VGDLNKFPELRWLDKYHLVVPTLYSAAVFAFGHFVGPHFGTNGWQFWVWVFCISTVLGYHGSYTINSLSHKFGNRRYETSDDSKNNFWLALVTLGEGWHNNHHHYPVSAKQGFYWWEVDFSYYTLFALSKLRLIWNLRGVPNRVRDHHGIFEAEVLADEDLKELQISQ
jgi:stearoyl-CoA desaturase (delta-9 desaturase)